MKKYRLLKELPGIKKGTILGIMEIMHIYDMDKSFNNFKDNDIESYIKLNYSEWFEEVREDDLGNIFDKCKCTPGTIIFQNDMFDKNKVKQEIYQWAIDMLEELSNPVDLPNTIYNKISELKRLKEKI
jgi:hypothetical protein